MIAVVGPSRPVLLLGLDGATHRVLEPLLALGDLPTIARLTTAGACGVLHSTVPPITPAAWSSFMTGKNPGKHGIYDFRVYDPQSYGDTFVTSQALRAATLWEILTGVGRRVGVVNLPVMYPPDARSGTVVSGFDTPSTEAMFTTPPELRARILARMPDYLLAAYPDPTDPMLAGDAPFERFLADVERACVQRARVALDLLAEGSFDVLMVHFQDIDVLQHTLWQYVEEPDRHPARWARIRQVYRRLDELIGQLLTAVSAETLVIVLSDHGFGPCFGRLYPNTLLQDWGYLARRKRPKSLRRSLRKRLVRLGLAVPRAKPRYVSWMAESRAHDLVQALPVDWHRTVAYVPLAEQYALLYLNLRGREPQGVVEPGLAARRLGDELRERLTAARDPHDDALAFAAVLAGEVVYPDDPLGRRPDLILIPREGFTAGRDLAFGDWAPHRDIVNGMHRRDGVLIVAGDGVRPGPLADGADLVDLAPTVLAVAGVPVPSDMDGRVLVELFEEPLAVTTAPPSAAPARTDIDLDAADEETVMQRLKALGYMA